MDKLQFLVLIYGMNVTAGRRLRAAARASEALHRMTS